MEFKAGDYIHISEKLTGSREAFEVWLRSCGTPLSVGAGVSILRGKCIVFAKPQPHREALWLSHRYFKDKMVRNVTKEVLAAFLSPPVRVKAPSGLEVEVSQDLARKLKWNPAG